MKLTIVYRRNLRKMLTLTKIVIKANLFHLKKTAQLLINHSIHLSSFFWLSAVKRMTLRVFSLLMESTCFLLDLVCVAVLLTNDLFVTYVSYRKIWLVQPICWKSHFVMATYSFSAQMIHLQQNNNQSRVVVWTFAPANWNNILRCFLGCTTTIWTRVTNVRRAKCFLHLMLLDPTNSNLGNKL